MTIPGAISVAAAGLGLAFAVLSLWMTRAPGWKEMRYFALLSVTAGLYCLFDSVPSSDASDAIVSWASRLSMFSAAFHGPAWLLYRAAQDRRSPGKLEWTVLAVAVVIAVTALIPDVVISDRVAHHHVAWLGVTYADAQPTTFGAAAFMLYCGTLVLPFGSYLRAARRGAPAALPQATGIGVLGMTAANDAMVGAGVYSGPYLLAVGFTAAIGFAGGAMVVRFIDQARRLDTISRELEAEVERRTKELADTQLALLRAEKLAALGRVAAGVAHEINNPASVVLANLDYIRIQLEETGGQPPKDMGECLGESTQAIRRIARIVRQLVDAGRAGRESVVDRYPFPVLETLEAAVASARLEIPRDVVVEVTGAESIHAMGDPTLLEQVAVNLVINAAHAVAAKPGARSIQVSVWRDDEKVVVDVRDDGPGIAPEIRDHVFEPFFTTKKIGKGTGLGLAVSMGLMRAQSGSLAVASSGPQGTCMRAILEPGDPVELRSSNPGLEVALSPRLRLLLIDDDQSVRSALHRQLQPYFDVVSVDGVDPALRFIETGEQPVDVVLCDMMMPNGGGRRFEKEVLQSSPETAGRTIYFTGGLTDESSRQFFANHAPRALHKPIDPKTVLHLAEGFPAAPSRERPVPRGNSPDKPPRSAVS